ncbi:hypothetical protein AB833_17435 [Chromatiales bacterium (ex Bugula neritina AB1)]|nr:hypothetical protein AB833_17435 [Chromatiales bacterium (ex Bugula neritina AB1)]
MKLGFKLPLKIVNSKRNTTKRQLMFMTNNTLKQYKKIRKLGMSLNEKYLQCLDPQDIKISGRVLGILKGEKLLFSSEEDLDRIYNFVVYDYKNIKGKNLVQIYKDKNKNLTEEELLIINSSLSSSSSLYKVVSLNTQNCTLELKDLINNENKNIHMLDIQLSSNPSVQNLILYTRIIPFPGFNASSGASLLFDASCKDSILEKYKKKMKKIVVGDEQTKLAAAFFQLYQKYGFKNVRHQ